MKFRNFLLSILYFSVLTLTANAQTDVGVIGGVITDPDGAVIPDAKVKATLVSEKVDKQIFITSSDERGRFSFLKLPVGIYELEVTLGWSQIKPKKRVEVKVGNNPKEEIQFKNWYIEACSNVKVSQNSKLVTDKDKAEIVKQMLKNLINNHNDSLIKEQLKSKLILSTKNIKPKWLNQYIKEKFKLMKQSEIQSKADEKGDFLYLVFSKLRVQGRCVEVSLDNTWAVGKNSGLGYVSGGGQTYEFRKVKGRWIRKIYYRLGFITYRKI